MLPSDCYPLKRAVAQLGRALEWGSRGRGFESRRPDHREKLIEASLIGHLIQRTMKLAHQLLFHGSTASAKRKLPREEECNFANH